MGTCQDLCRKQPIQNGSSIPSSGSQIQIHEQNQHEEPIELFNPASQLIQNVVQLYRDEELFTENDSPQLSTINDVPLQKIQSYSYFRSVNLDQVTQQESNVTETMTANFIQPKSQKDVVMEMEKLKTQTKRADTRKITKKRAHRSSQQIPSGSRGFLSQDMVSSGSMMEKSVRSVSHGSSPMRSILKAASSMGTSMQLKAKKVRFKKVPEKDVMVISSAFAQKNYIIKL